MTQKILIITHNFPPLEGGISTHTYEIARNLSKQNSKVFVVASAIKKTRDFDCQQSFKIMRMPEIKNNFLRFLITFYYSCLGMVKYKPDLIFTTHWRNAGLAAAFVVCIFRKPHYVAVHGSEINFPKNNKFIFCLFRFVVKNSSKIIATGIYQKILLERLMVPSEKIRIVPVGVNISRFKEISVESVERLKKEYNIKDKKVLMTIGRLTPRKGQDFVIKSLRQIIRECPNLVYIIVGRGSEKERLEALTEELGLRDKIIFAGFVPYKLIPAYYALCDIFVMPNRIVNEDIEGFGIVFAEANICGKPVVVGNTGGVEAIVKNGENGFLVNPNKEEEIAQAVLRLLKNPILSRVMGENGRKKVEENFSYDKISTMMLDIFNEESRCLWK